MGKGVYYKEDIIEEMSKELGISIKELTEIVNTNISYIKKSIQENEILLISLPNLAKLRFNLRLGMSSRYEHRDSKIHEKKVKGLDKKIKLLSSYYCPTLVNFNKPLFERLYRKITKKHVTGIYDKMYKMWAEIEKENNRLKSNK